ncbi:MAG: hypothetical protein ACYCXW_04790 [Solirubrobacteraceae bacterium]
MAEPVVVFAARVLVFAAPVLVFAAPVLVFATPVLVFATPEVVLPLCAVPVSLSAVTDAAPSGPAPWWIDCPGRGSWGADARVTCGAGAIAAPPLTGTDFAEATSATTAESAVAWLEPDELRAVKMW